MGYETRGPRRQGDANQPLWLCSQQSAWPSLEADEDGSSTVGQSIGGALPTVRSTATSAKEAAIPSCSSEPCTDPGRFGSERQGSNGGGGEQAGQLNLPARLGAPTGFILRNSSNVCYINSWCHAANHGRLSTAIRILLKQGSTHLLSLLPWRQALSQWQNVHQQQDVSEFASFLLDFARPEAYQGHWEARLIHEGSPPTIRILDSGACFSPIVIDLTGPTLQRCVYSWHTQANTHALAQAPLLLLLALKRFRMDDDSSTGVIKDTQSVTICAGELVRIPSFDSNAGLSMTIVAYVVMGVVFHIGDTIKAGHYRSALSGSDPTTNQHVLHLSDDNSKLQISTTSNDLINSGGYLVGLRRLDSFSHLEGANRP